jgi:hypothetical protein
MTSTWAGATQGASSGFNTLRRRCLPRACLFVLLLRFGLDNPLALGIHDVVMQCSGGIGAKKCS